MLSIDRMLKDVAYTGLCGAILFSLFIIDYSLGNGFVDMIQKLMCKITCFVKKSIREEVKLTKGEDTQIPFNFPTLLIEGLVLLLTRAVLKNYKFPHGKNRLDELIHESKETLRVTEQFLEKWRMRRVPTASSYLDEEPQEIKPLKLEVPILHMAIVDTRGRGKQQERGDAGDSPTYSNSAILSVVSLIEEDGTNPLLQDDGLPEDFERNDDMQNRHLWDVEEEDPNFEY